MSGLHQLTHQRARCWTVALFAWLLISPPGFAEQDLTLSGAWIRYLPGSGPMAGYFTLSNGSDQPISIVAASSPAFEQIDLHETVERGGETSMQSVEGGVTVAAKDSITFRPGGYHLMLMQRQTAINIGDVIDITLSFGDGRSLTAPFLVKAPGTQ
jgi:copper(I)-binding protein